MMVHYSGDGQERSDTFLLEKQTACHAQGIMKHGPQVVVGFGTESHMWQCVYVSGSVLIIFVENVNAYKIS